MQGLKKLEFQLALQRSSSKILITLASVLFWCDPSVVLKCSHHKYLKYLGREFKHIHCLTHNLFLTTALLSLMQRCPYSEGNDLMNPGFAGSAVSDLAPVVRRLDNAIHLLNNPGLELPVRRSSTVPVFSRILAIALKD